MTLTAPDGSPARTVAKGGFVPGGDRDPFYTAIMLLGLSAVTIGNGFFKPNISTMVGSLYATGDRRRDAGFTIFYMGINLGSLFSQILCPLLAVGMGVVGGARLVGGVRVGGDRHGGVVGADPVRRAGDGGYRRDAGRGDRRQRHRPQPADLRPRAAGDPAGLVPVQRT